MKSLGFKYLKRGRALTLFVILTLSSALFSTTALSLLGFYRSFTAYLGEGEDIVAIYDGSSSTPFTGLVPARLAERAMSINGVIACSPEAIAPCIIKGEPVFLRGIVPEGFTKLNRLTILEGEMLELSDLNSAIVGRNVAQRLDLKPGDVILVLGVLTDRYLQLQVKGVYESRSAMDDEVLAPLHVGQWLRGAGYGHVTLIRVKVDRGVVGPAEIFEEVAEGAPMPSRGGGPSLPASPAGPARFGIEGIGVAEARKFMSSYLDEYGVTEEALLTLSATAFLFSTATVAMASRTIIIQHRGEIGVLRSLGASRKLLKADVLIKLLPWSLAASSIGVILAVALLTAMRGRGLLQVLSHSVPIQPDPLVIALNFALSLAAVSICVLRADLE